MSTQPQENLSTDWLTPTEAEKSDPFFIALHQWHERAAERLKEHLSCTPFYAKRAAKAAAAGDEMAYWRDLQGSCATMELPSKSSSTPDPYPTREAFNLTHAQQQ